MNLKKSFIIAMAIIGVVACLRAAINVYRTDNLYHQLQMKQDLRKLEKEMAENDRRHIAFMLNGVKKLEPGIYTIGDSNINYTIYIPGPDDDDDSDTLKVTITDFMGSRTIPIPIIYEGEE